MGSLFSKIYLLFVTDKNIFANEKHISRNILTNHDPDLVNQNRYLEAVENAKRNLVRH